MVWFFWFALIFLAYTFIGYPLLLFVLSTWRGRPHRRATIWPKVSIIIATHNQADLLGSKIVNLLELIYPADKLEIIVASDGSDDSTRDIVRSFASRGVRFVESPERRGKHYVQMLARDVSRGEVLVFTDVSVKLKADAVQKIVSNFADSSVGCVSSEDELVGEESGGLSERFYVPYEMWLRHLEAGVGSLVGLSGSFFAVRRELCAVWHPHQSSDFFLALHAAGQGMRSVMDPECRAHYRVARTEKAEFRRKVRTITHGLDVLFTHAHLLNPLRYGLFSWQLISHKLFRWLVPLGILVVLLANAFLWNAGEFYKLALALQAGLYGAGMLALVVKRLAALRAFKLASFFLLGNVATVVAWMKFLLGERFVTWQPTRRS